MKDNTVLCVLNRLFFTKGEKGSSSLPKEERYYSADLRQTFTGIQANEAPVKCLIKEAHDANNDVDEVIYLCSNKCYEKSIPASAVIHLSAFGSFSGERISVEEFFIGRITEFCKSNGIKTPTFSPLPYNPARPADSIPALNEYLSGQYEVCIDITGGRRDAVILQALAIQLLKMQSSASDIGSVVYASFDERAIIRQNTTFDLIELINSIDSFMRYGRADQLCSFFKNRRYISDETLNLCERMEDFSNALSLCQVNDIDEKTRAVQLAMKHVDAALCAKSENYRLISSAINAIEDPDGWISDMSAEEALEEIRRSSIQVEIDNLSMNQIRANLEQARLANTIVRSELLLHGLIPTMQKKFIPETEDNDRLIINSIIWCVNHQMIQQALCIYRERISECLLHLGFFKPTAHFNNLNESDKRDIACDIGLRCQIGDGVGSHKSLFFLSNPNNGDDYNDYFSFCESRYNQLHLIIAWYKYLHGTRNKIMHVSAMQEGLGYKFSCHFLGKTLRGNLSIAELKSDIVEALSCIKTTTSVDMSSWANAYNSAKGRHGESGSAPVYSSTGNSELSTVGTVAELQMLLLKFANGYREVNFDEFKKWCEKEERKQLNKRSLGLNPNQPFYKGLCEKHGRKFAYRREADAIYLSF